MSFRWKGTVAQNPLWNGTEINRIQRNGSTFWERRIEATIPGNQTNFDLRSWILNNTSWDGSSVLDILINVGTSSNNASFFRTGTSSGAALSLTGSDFPSGSRIEMVWRNTVNIAGLGGRGGSATATGSSSSSPASVTGSTTNGTNGGDAIFVYNGAASGVEIILDFNGWTGTVAGGGGGGGSIVYASAVSGGSAGTIYLPTAAGGGGGAAHSSSAGGAGGSASSVGGHPAQSGSSGGSTSGGSGGRAVEAQGGNGGGRGSAGQASSPSSGNRVVSRGSPGAAGRAIGWYMNQPNVGLTLRNAQNVTWYGTR